MAAVCPYAVIGSGPYAMTAVVPSQPDRGAAVWYRQGDEARFLAVGVYTGRTDGGVENPAATAIHGTPAVSLCLRDLQGRVTECLEYQQFLTTRPMTIEEGVPTFRCRIECVTGVSRRTTQAYFCIRIDATVIVAGGAACQVTLYTCPLDVRAKRVHGSKHPRVPDVVTKREKLDGDAGDDFRLGGIEGRQADAESRQASLEGRQAEIESRQANVEAWLAAAAGAKVSTAPVEVASEEAETAAGADADSMGGRGERPSFESELASSRFLQHLTRRIEFLEANQSRRANVEAWLVAAPGTKVSTANSSKRIKANTA